MRDERKLRIVAALILFLRRTASVPTLALCQPVTPDRRVRAVLQCYRRKVTPIDT